MMEDEVEVALIKARAIEEAIAMGFTFLGKRLVSVSDLHALRNRYIDSLDYERDDLKNVRSIRRIK